MARVVVGVDGSDRAKRALVRAVEEAGLRDAPLEAVHVYKPAHDVGEDLAGLGRGLNRGSASAPTTSTGADAKQEHARRRAYDLLSDAVDDAMAGSDAPRPRLVVIANDDVTEAITDHAAGADLLVIGLRRRSPVGKLVLGSDARDIILQSPVPVLAVHDDGDF